MQAVLGSWSCAFVLRSTIPARNPRLLGQGYGELLAALLISGPRRYVDFQKLVTRLIVFAYHRLELQGPFRDAECLS